MLSVSLELFCFFFFVFVVAFFVHEFFLEGLINPDCLPLNPDWTLIFLDPCHFSFTAWDNLKFVWDVRQMLFSAMIRIT